MKNLNDQHQLAERELRKIFDVINRENQTFADLQSQLEEAKQQRAAAAADSLLGGASKSNNDKSISEIELKINSQRALLGELRRRHSQAAACELQARLTLRENEREHLIERMNAAQSEALKLEKEMMLKRREYSDCEPILAKFDRDLDYMQSGVEDPLGDLRGDPNYLHKRIVDDPHLTIDRPAAFALLDQWQRGVEGVRNHHGDVSKMIIYPNDCVLIYSKASGEILDYSIFACNDAQGSEAPRSFRPDHFEAGFRFDLTQRKRELIRQHGLSRSVAPIADHQDADAADDLPQVRPLSKIA